MTRRRRKLKDQYKEVPDAAYRKRTVIKMLLHLMEKYESRALLILGIILFISGIYGEYLGLPDYYVNPGRVSNPARTGPIMMPYWTNCIWGVFFAGFYIKEKLGRKN